MLIVFIATLVLTVANTFLGDNNLQENQTGTLTIGNESVHYEKVGKCLEVIDGNTIQVYGVGRVQLIQVDSPDDKQPEDKFGRTLAIVYTNTTDINRELLDNNLAEISYFTPSEFKKGEV